MVDSNQYILNEIRTMVWSGFYSPANVQQGAEEIFEEDSDESMLRAAILSEFAKKAEAEKLWPIFTDCDRLDDAFVDLRSHGIIALHNAGMTISDGESDVGQVLHKKGRAGIVGYCFYHGQDLERAVNGAGLWLAFGDLDCKTEQKIAVGELIKKTVERFGLGVEWNGDPERRICITKIDWKRRRKI